MKRLSILTWLYVLLNVVSVQAQTAPLVLAAGECRLITGSIEPALWRDGNGRTVDDLVGTGSGGVMGGATVWTGASLDTKRGEYNWRAQGGHGSTGDNSSFVNRLLTDRQWARNRDPSSIAILQAALAGFKAGRPVTLYSDGAPSTTHTYAQEVYMPNVDRTVRISWAAWPGSDPDLRCIEWDNAAHVWLPPSDPIKGTTTLRAVWDEAGQRVLFHDDYMLWAYDPVRPAGSRIYAVSAMGSPHAQGDNDNFGAAMHKKLQLFVQFGGVTTNGKYGMSLYEVGGTVQPSIRKNVTLVDAQGAPFTFPEYADGGTIFRAAGVWYDEEFADIGIWKGAKLASGGDNADILYPVTLQKQSDGSWRGVVKPEKMKGKPSLAPRQGVYTKIQYVAALKAMVVMNNVAEGIWACRRPGILTSGTVNP